MKKKNFDYFQKLGIKNKIKKEKKSGKFVFPPVSQSSRNLHKNFSNNFNSVTDNQDVPLKEKIDQAPETLNNFYSCRNNFILPYMNGYNSNHNNKFENPKLQVKELQNYLKNLRSKHKVTQKPRAKKIVAKAKFTEKESIKNRDPSKRRNLYALLNFSAI